MWEYGYIDELYHYGVKGMKWGVRRARGHGGPSVNIGGKRKLAGYRKDLEILDNGGHLSKGLTKKRQATYDARDRQNLENKIAKLETKFGRKIERKYTKAGKKAGAADYQRDKGDKAYDAHNKNAKALESMAKKYDATGQIAKAELARRSANALRARGENVRAEQYRMADAYMKRSDKLNKKASDFATNTNVNLGKKKVDEILKNSRQKGYDSAKRIDEYNREAQIADTLGTSGYAAYNYIRGKS